MRLRTLLNGVAIAVLGIGLVGCAAKSGSRGADPYKSGAHGDGSSKTGGIGLGTLQRVHFDFDSSNLDSDSRNVLKNNADIMKSSDKMRVLVEGHCDQRGSNEYNIALGERRAKSVVDYLVGLGVPRRRLETKSWGEERPLDPATTGSAYSLNRRAEFVILRK